MAKPDTSAQRETIYSEITQTIITELEAGNLPWVQPWGPGSAALGMPQNATTLRAYSGINILILWSAAVKRGYLPQTVCNDAPDVAVLAGGESGSGARSLPAIDRRAAYG